MLAISCHFNHAWPERINIRCPAVKRSIQLCHSYIYSTAAATAFISLPCLYSPLAHIPYNFWTPSF